MRALPLWVGLLLSMLLVSLASAQQATPADREAISTLLEGLRAREANLPPLTVAGVYTAFYTPLHWMELRRAFDVGGGTEKEWEAMFRGDRTAVGVVVWESADGDRWEREYQGLYRGPNNWVYPHAGDPRSLVADMYRKEIGSPDAVVIVETRGTVDGIWGYPSVTVEPPEHRRAVEAVGDWLGLLSPTGASFNDTIVRALAAADWRFSPVAHAGQTATVSAASFTPQREQAVEWALEVDAQTFEPVAYRRVRVWGRGKGHATQVYWSDYQPLPGLEMRLPATMTHWDFRYGFSEGSPLVRSMKFVCVDALPTAPGSQPSIVPRCAIRDTGNAEGDVLALAGPAYGDRFLRHVSGFAAAGPPVPPEDLMKLDPAVMTDDIKARYGFQ
jgi:hypothetical protein